MAVNRQIVLRERPGAEIDDSCFELVDGEVSTPGEGQALLRTLNVAIDPAILTWLDAHGSGYLPAVEIGAPVRASGVGLVVESNAEELPVGSLVSALTGWQEYSLTCAGYDPIWEHGTVAPEGSAPADVPTLLGNIGWTAYFGVRELDPQAGQTVVVSAAASGVGSLAGQLAKRRGCRVVGIAGTDEKCKLVVDEYGFDACINYRTEDVAARVIELCPDAVHGYFDNVGGETLDTLLRRIAPGARILLCGSISTLTTSEPYRLRHYDRLMSRRATMIGFNTADYFSEYDDATRELSEWRNDGTITFHIDEVDGLAHAPEALRRMLAGDHLGKLVVKVSAP